MRGRFLHSNLEGWEREQTTVSYDASSAHSVRHISTDIIQDAS